MKQLSLFTLLVAIVGLFACGKATVESENNRWKSNQERIGKLKTLYPSFATALDNTLKEAEAAMKSAEAVSNAEEKVKAMSAANDKAAPSFVSDLENMDRLIRDVQDQISKSKQAGGDPNDKTAIYDASMRADIAINEAKMQLQTAQITDVNGANAVAKTAKDNLTAAKSRLDDLVSAAEKKVNDAKKAADDAKTAADKKAEDDKKATADIKCSHCGSMSKAGTLKCSGCGAALSK